MQAAIKCAVTVLQMRKPCLEGLELKVWLLDMDVFQHAFRMVWTSRWGERMPNHKGGCKLARDSTYSTLITARLEHLLASQVL